MNIEKGAADRRLAPEDYMEVTARLGTWGGYFFFIWRTREMMLTIRIPS